MYGIHELKGFDREKCEKFISDIDWKGLNHNSVFADSSSFRCASRIPSSSSGMRKSFGQPVQIMYFRNDSLISFHVNCLARGGLFNLNWNTGNRFASFPPQSAASLDSVTISYRDLVQCYPELNQYKSGKYNVVIVWTLMLEKISRSAIKTVISNTIRFEEGQNVSICLINADKCFKKGK